MHRPGPEPASVERAAERIRTARRPLIVAGGGVHHSRAEEALRALAENAGIPVSETQAGRGSLRYDHPCELGSIGHTGTSASDDIARRADLVIGVGTRYSDFTTASRTLFARPDVGFVNINIAGADAHKQAGTPVIGVRTHHPRSARRRAQRPPGRRGVRARAPGGSQPVGAGRRPDHPLRRRR